jgi:hypothetical protein
MRYNDWPNRLADVVIRHHKASFSEHDLSFGAYENHIASSAPPATPPVNADAPPPGIPLDAVKAGNTWIAPLPGTDLMVIYNNSGTPIKTVNKADVDTGGGSGGAAAPFGGTGEGIRQFNAELAEDIRHHKAQIKQLEAAEKAATDRNRERIQADLSIARDRLAMDLRIAKMDDATKLKIARKEAELGLRGQDIQREGQALSAQGDLLNFASQLDPIKGSAALVGDPSGTTPFDVGAQEFRDMIAKASAGGVRDVTADLGAAGGLPRSRTINIKVGEKGGDDGDEEIVRVDRATGQFVDIIPIDTNAATGLKFGLPKGRTIPSPPIHFRASHGLALHDLDSQLGVNTGLNQPEVIPGLVPVGDQIGLTDIQPGDLELPPKSGEQPEIPDGFISGPAPGILPGAPQPPVPPGTPDPNLPTARTLAQVNADPRRLEYSQFGIDPFSLKAPQLLDQAKADAAARTESEAAEKKATDESFLVGVQGQPEVFLVKNGERFHIPNRATLFSLGFTFDDVQHISPENMANIPRGKTLPSQTPRLIATFDRQTGRPAPGIWIELNGKKSHVANTEELRELVRRGVVPGFDVERISLEEWDSSTNDLQPFLNDVQQAQQTVRLNLESVLGPDAIAQANLTGNDFQIPDTFNTAIANPNQFANKSFLFEPGAETNPRGNTLLGALGGSNIPRQQLLNMIRGFRPSTVGRTASVGFG